MAKTPLAGRTPAQIQAQSAGRHEPRPETRPGGRASSQVADHVLPQNLGSVIAGIEPCSFVDYPGKIADVVFLRGCNVRCPWCHNRAILATDLRGRSREAGQEAAAFLGAYLRDRAVLVDACVLSGGEATVSPHLLLLAAAVKRSGLALKIDTNGTRPEVVERLLALPPGLRPDCFALDIKAPLDGPGAEGLYRKALGTFGHLEVLGREFRGAEDLYRRALGVGSKEGTAPEVDGSAPNRASLSTAPHGAALSESASFAARVKKTALLLAGAAKEGKIEAFFRTTKAPYLSGEALEAIRSWRDSHAPWVAYATQEYLPPR